MHDENIACRHAFIIDKRGTFWPQTVLSMMSGVLLATDVLRSMVIVSQCLYAFIKVTRFEIAMVIHKYYSI